MTFSGDALSGLWGDGGLDCLFFCRAWLVALRAMSAMLPQDGAVANVPDDSMGAG